MKSKTDTLISKQELYRLRLKPLIEREIATDQEGIYLQKCHQEEWLNYIAEEMAHLSPEQLMTIPDEQLRGRIGRLMTLKVMFGMLNDFTPEQMKIFDESLVRG
jgi:hypothetical protein